MSGSRKRRNSGETVDDETKRQRTVEGSERGAEGGITAPVSDTPVRPKPTSEHQLTPRPPSATELGAVGGEESENFY